MLVTVNYFQEKNMTITYETITQQFKKLEDQISTRRAVLQKAVSELSNEYFTSLQLPGNTWRDVKYIS